MTDAAVLLRGVCLLCVSDPGMFGEKEVKSSALLKSTVSLFAHLKRESFLNLYLSVLCSVYAAVLCENVPLTETGAETSDGGAQIETDSRAARGRYEAFTRTRGWEGKKKDRGQQIEELESRERPAQCKHSILSVSIS